eukprot:ctg_552.g254
MGRTARRKFFWDGWSSRLPRRRARTPVLQRLSRALPEAALWLLVDVVEAIVRFTQNVVLRRLDGSADLDIEVITQVVGVQEEPYVDPLHHWELTRELWYELPGGQRMYLPGHSRYVEDTSLQEALRRAREQRPSRLWWREEGEDDGEVLCQVRQRMRVYIHDTAAAGMAAEDEAEQGAREERPPESTLNLQLGQHDQVAGGKTTPRALHFRGDADVGGAGHVRAVAQVETAPCSQVKTEDDADQRPGESEHPLAVRAPHVEEHRLPAEHAHFEEVPLHLGVHQGHVGLVHHGRGLRQHLLARLHEERESGERGRALDQLTHGRGTKKGRVHVALRRCLRAAGFTRNQRANTRGGPPARSPKTHRDRRTGMRLAFRSGGVLKTCPATELNFRQPHSRGQSGRWSVLGSVWAGTASGSVGSWELGECWRVSA